MTKGRSSLARSSGTQSRRSALSWTRTHAAPSTGSGAISSTAAMPAGSRVGHQSRPTAGDEAAEDGQRLLVGEHERGHAEADSAYEALRTRDVTIVLKPTTQPWGNRSQLFRDPDGNLVNLFAPVGPGSRAER